MARYPRDSSSKSTSECVRKHRKINDFRDKGREGALRFGRWLSGGLWILARCHPERTKKSEEKTFFANSKLAASEAVRKKQKNMKIRTTFVTENIKAHGLSPLKKNRIHKIAASIMYREDRRNFSI